MLILSSLILGVLSSLAASLVWLLALRAVRPKVEISKEISEEIVDGKPLYRIKFVNRSRRALVDLRLELALVTPTAMKGGLVKRKTTLRLGVIPMVVPGRRADNDDDNAFRVRSDDDLRSRLAEAGGAAYLRFRLYARDEVSGFGKVFEASFHDARTEIIRGYFSKGQAIEIVRAEGGQPQLEAV
jgi:hypothetical protein